MKNPIDKSQPYFIKVSDEPVKTLSSEQKARLNRKGNELFNSNDVLSAARIFITTGYSDGLTRIGDFYMEKGAQIEALRYYKLAHNSYKMDIVIANMVRVIKSMIKL